MATITPTVSPATGLSAYGSTIAITAGTVAGTVEGDWVSFADAWVLEGVLINYNEDSGTDMTQAVLSFQILHDDGNAYTIRLATGLAYEITLTADLVNAYMSVGLPTLTAGLVQISGVVAVRAQAVVTGNLVGADALSVTFRFRRTGTG